MENNNTNLSSGQVVLCSQIKTKKDFFNLNIFKTENNPWLQITQSLKKTDQYNDFQKLDFRDYNLFIKITKVTLKVPVTLTPSNINPFVQIDRLMKENARFILKKVDKNGKEISTYIDLIYNPNNESDSLNGVEYLSQIKHFECNSFNSFKIDSLKENLFELIIPFAPAYSELSVDVSFEIVASLKGFVVHKKVEKETVEKQKLKRKEIKAELFEIKDRIYAAINFTDEVNPIAKNSFLNLSYNRLIKLIEKM